MIHGRQEYLYLFLCKRKEKRALALCEYFGKMFGVLYHHIPISKAQGVFNSYYSRQNVELFYICQHLASLIFQKMYYYYL